MRTARPQHLRVQVGPAADEVGHLAGERVEEHAVDGEVAPLRVLLGGAEDHLVRPPRVAVIAVAAERRHLHLQRPPPQHLDDAERHPDGDRAGEQAPHVVGQRRRGDVVVLRLDPQQLVADAAAGEKGLVAGLLEGADDLDGELTLGLRGRHRALAPAAAA
jgi:hypothetical protein